MDDSIFEKPQILWAAPNRCHLTYKKFLVLDLARKDLDACLACLDRGQYPHLRLDIVFKLNERFRMVYEKSSGELYLSDSVSIFSEKNKALLEDRGNNKQFSGRIDKDIINSWLVETLHKYGYELLCLESVGFAGRILRTNFTGNIAPDIEVLATYPKNYGFAHICKDLSIFTLNPAHGGFDPHTVLCHMFYKHYLVLYLFYKDVELMKKLLDAGRHQLLGNAVIVNLDHDFTLWQEKTSGELRLEKSDVEITTIKTVRGSKSKNTPGSKLPTWMIEQLQKRGFSKFETRQEVSLPKTFGRIFASMLLIIGIALVLAARTLARSAPSDAITKPLLFLMAVLCLTAAIVAVVSEIKDHGKVFFTENYNFLVNDSC